MDAFHVNTVDTTGAGDSFVGALLTKIVSDQAILEVKFNFLFYLFFKKFFFLVISFNIGSFFFF